MIYLPHAFIVINRKIKYSFIRKLSHLEKITLLLIQIFLHTYFKIFIDELGKFFFYIQIVSDWIDLTPDTIYSLSQFGKINISLLPKELLLNTLISINKKQNLLFANLNLSPYTNPFANIPGIIERRSEFRGGIRRRIISLPCSLARKHELQGRERGKLRSRFIFNVIPALLSSRYYPVLSPFRAH